MNLKPEDIKETILLPTHLRQEHEDDKLGILDYIIFPEDIEYYSRFHLKEDYRERIYSDKLEIHVLELPKLEQRLYPESKLLNWAKFFRAEKKGVLKDLAETDPYIKKAHDSLLHMSEDERKRIKYEEREKAIRDYNHLMYCGKKEGIAEEMEHGIQVLIETCQKFSILRDDTKQTIMQQYSLSKETAEQYLQKYWTI